MKIYLMRIVNLKNGEVLHTGLYSTISNAMRFAEDWIKVRVENNPLFEMRVQCRIDVQDYTVDQGLLIVDEQSRATYVA